MIRRYTAVLLASLLLLGASGCSSRPSTMPLNDQAPVTETLPGSAGEPDTDTGTGESTESIAADSTDGTVSTDTAAASAAAATAPVQLSGSDEPQPATLMPTVDPNLVSTHPGSADDDQMGSYDPQSATAPAETIADKTAATAPANKATEKAASGKLATKGGASGGKLQISVQTVEVDADQLKSKDYTVDLLITLDKNPGITYSEWGLQLDKRCTYTADTDDLPIDTVFFINDASTFLWTAWTSGSKVTSKTGGILKLHVKLPRDAKSGSSYPITYADTSLQPAPHIWQNSDDDWVSSKEVGWINGGVIVK